MSMIFISSTFINGYNTTITWLNLRVVTLPVHLLPTQSSNTSQYNIVIDGLVKPNACSLLIFKKRNFVFRIHKSMQLPSFLPHQSPYKIQYLARLTA